MLVFLQKEPGYGRVEALLKRAMSGEVKLHISAINMAEVQYYVIRRGRDAAKILAALEALPFRVESADSYIPAAVELKAKYGIPLPDCFAAAVAQDLKCPLVTGDREFRKLGEAVTVEWLR